MDIWKQLLAAMLVMATLAGCAGMTERQEHTAIGAAVGGVTGSALTNGSGVGTVGGAVIGGYIGNQMRH